MEEELFAIEEGFWLRGQKYFLENVDDESLLAFPQAREMHGIHSREQVVATATDENRWREPRIENRNALSLGGSAAIISYKIDVRRADGIAYSALVSSAYVRRGERWKLAFHQHSPVGS